MNLEYRYRKPEKTSGENKKSPLLLVLHGLGADENDLFGLAPYMDKRFFIVSPRAPFALPYGGYAWFELLIEPNNIGINVKEFKQSSEMILEFVDKLAAEHDLDAEKVYLCGFSQGAIMSLSVLLTEPEKFAGVAAMSGRAMPEMLPEQNDLDALKDFPILVTHGIYDPVLPIANGRATNEILSSLPVNLEYKEYPMAHEISQESLHDVSNWLSAELDKKSEEYV